MSTCHDIVSLSFRHVILSYTNTIIYTNLIRIHLDNNNVNKLTMKQLLINICKLNYNCEHISAELYTLTNNNNKTNYILLQTKYDI